MFVPIHIRSGRRYPQIGAATKAVWESHPATKGTYKYEQVKQAPPPVEAKKVTKKATKPKK